MYTIRFRETVDGAFEGDFYHPDYEESGQPLVIGKSLLEPQ